MENTEIYEYTAVYQLNKKGKTVATDAQVNRIERRKLEFREKITRAALKLFEEQGVADTSVASIIKEADIAHKTFFNHFPSKDHLLLHIASTFGGNAYDVFREGIKNVNSPQKRIEYCLINIAKALAVVHPNYKELLNFYLISGAGAVDLRSEQQVEFSKVIGEIIADADEHNLLRPGQDAQTYTEIVVGVCVSTLLNWSLEDDYPIVAKMEKIIGFVNASVFKDE